MNRQAAIAEAHKFADAVVREVRGVIRDAVEYRRTEPHRFALFHGRMALYWNGRRGLWARIAEGHHRRFAARYSAKAWALDQDLARSCSLESGQERAA